MNELSALVSFLTKAKSYPALQGWCLIRIPGIEKYSAWTHQWITIEVSYHAHGFFIILV